MCGIILSHPIDTIKTHIQTGNTFNTFNITLNNLYKGLLSPLLGVGIEKAIVFGTYNFFLQKININTDTTITGTTITGTTTKGITTNGIYNNNKKPSYDVPVAGALAGLSASIIVSPYERIKILKQHSKQIIVKDINFKFLFKGISATLTREVPGFAIYFSVYENLKYHTFTKYNEKITYTNAFIYGGISGITAWVFIYPQDRIKTIIQSQTQLLTNTNKQHTFMLVMKDIYAKGGLKYFYNGFSWAIFRATLLHSGTFCIMEILQNL